MNRLTLSVIITVLLAAAVFVWGSEYKCSLYYGHSESRSPIPVAKLLSERERAAPAASVDVRLDQAGFFALAVLLFGFFRGIRAGFNRVPVPVPNHPSVDRSCCLIHFSFRPPPAMAV